SVVETDAGISGSFVYNTDLFDPETIQRMAERYQMLLDAMVADPDQRLNEISLLTQSERQQLLVDWNGSPTVYPPVQCVHQLFEEQVERTPETVAVIFDQQRYSYRELNQRANQVAHHLQSLGVGPDVRVGLFMERSLDNLVALLGILKAGGAYVPLDPIYPQERIRFMLEDVQVSALVTQSALAAELPDLGDMRVVCIDGDWPAISQHSDENPPITVIPSNLIYVLFTSGSTGRPKGVAVEHRNYLNYFHGVMPRLKVTPGMSFAMVSTFSTDLGTVQFWAPLTTGGTTHIISYERATDPDAMVDYFSRHTIDALKLVPSHFDAWQGAPGSETIVPRKLVIFTGEASQWETVNGVKALNPDCMIQDHYGATETTCATLTCVVPDAPPDDHLAT
ncbi:MAG: AMP-binding protein, partial [bacterium]|nr:AMP-binding protein [bacterium]